MNVGVEISFFAALALWAAIARDLYIRKRVEKSEDLARQDRIEKERLDREQISDIAIISHVPAWMEVDEKQSERELRRELEAEKEKNRLLEIENAGLEARLADCAPNNKT